MKKLVLTLAYLAPLMVAPQLAVAAQQADASTCYTIRDMDARAACLARAHGDPGRCYAVQAADKRAACLAEVRQ